MTTPASAVKATLLWRPTNPLPPCYNIAPSTTQALIQQDRDTFARKLVALRWGLIGFGSDGPDRSITTSGSTAAR